MTKKLKVLSSTAIASVMATSAIVPVAAAAVETPATQLDTVVIEKDGQLISLPTADYSQALGAGIIASDDVAYVSAKDGKYYSKADYAQAFGAKGNIADALQLLNENNEDVTVSNVLEGEIKNGELVAKDNQQPEVPAGDFQVESVKAINASHVSVTFNDKVDYASAVTKFAENYIFTKNGEKFEGQALENAVESVYLMADGKTVVFEFKTVKDSQGEDTGFGILNHGDQYGIDVKNAVKNAKGEKLEAYGDTQKEFRDQAAPVITDTKFKGDTVEIYYNEPVNIKHDDFGLSIDGSKIVDKGAVVGETSAKVAEISSSIRPVQVKEGAEEVKEIQYVLTVKLTDKAPKELLEKGTHEVVVYNMRDQVKSTSQAGNKVQLARTSYEVKEGQETDLAVVAIDPIDFNSLNVEFNKAPSKAKITVYKGETKFYEKDLSSPGADVKVDLPYTIKSEQDGITPLYAKDATSTDVRVVVENYEDENAKLGEKVEKTLTLVREATKPAPVKDGIKVDYTLDDDGFLVEGNAPTITIDLLGEGDYSATGLEFVEDATKALQHIKVLDKDGVSRTIENVVIEDKTKLKITLKKADGKKQKFEDLFNLTVKVDANAVKVGTDKIDVPSPKTMKKNDNWTEGEATNELTNDAFQVIVEKNKDAEDEDSNFKYIEGVTKVESNKENTNVITVTYTDSMTASAANAANYMLDGKALPQGTKMSMDATGKVVTITLPKGSVEKTHEARLQITKDVKTLNNEIIVGSLTDKEMYMTKETFTITDNTAPTLASAQYAVAKADDKTASVIELTFSEAIKATDLTNAKDNFEFLANGTKAIEIKAVEAVDGDDNENKVTITLAEAVSTQQKATITVASKDKDGNDVTIVITDEADNKLTKGSTVTIPAKSVVVSDKAKEVAAKAAAIAEAEEKVTNAEKALEAAKKAAENDETVKEAMADAKEAAIEEVQAVKDAQTALENANNAKTAAEADINSTDAEAAKTALATAKTAAEEADVKDVEAVKEAVKKANELVLDSAEKEDIDAATKAINVAVAEAKVANAEKALEDAKKAAETNPAVVEAVAAAKEEAIKEVQAVKDAETALTKAQEELAAAKQ